MPRPMWIYRHRKNAEPPLAWIFRRIHPKFTSRVIWATEENARST